MAIEGPLRELGIHDVFQLLDLSRKTGALRVTSELRDDEGSVLFDGGRVIHASIRSNPTTIERILRQAGKITENDMTQALDGDVSIPLGDRLVAMRAITQRELERHLRQSIENVIFELMSWREGYFSFEERPVGDTPLDARVRIATESLLMEGARRIDEWSLIADRVPSLSVIPALAALSDDRSSALDLLPHEWEVLMMIDSRRDLRGIAGALGRSEFDVARIVYGLLSTEVVILRAAEGRPVSSEQRVIDAAPAIDRAREALDGGRAEEALTAAREAMEVNPDSLEARLLIARAFGRLSRHQDAVDELRKGVQFDPLSPDVHLALGHAAIRVGDFANARASWEHFVRLAPTSPEVPRVSAALDLLTRLLYVLDSHVDV